MENQNDHPILIIGGGAAGFFAAIAAAEASPGIRVVILEKGKNVLQKVKVSGGGRCNVTHSCFEPRELVRHYPRGEKALLGPFHRFGPADTVEWFSSRGVPLKTESDGRMFPVTDSSQSIIDCLTGAARRAGVEVRTGQNVSSISPPNEQHPTWLVKTQDGGSYFPKKLMMATGSSPRIWQVLESLGHQIVPPVPSLFTFNIKDERISGLAGISVPVAEVKVLDSKLSASGPLLITHWGMSGPAILRLSAWGARELHEQGYRFDISVNWLGSTRLHEAADILRSTKNEHVRKQVSNICPFGDIPKRFWEKSIAAVGISPALRWADLGKKQLNALASAFTEGKFQVDGKSTFKEEFVTAGGVQLDEMNLKTFESKLHPGLFLAGEVLDIDAITGGFNFQAAWTGGWLAGKAMANE